MVTPPAETYLFAVVVTIEGCQILMLSSCYYPNILIVSGGCSMCHEKATGGLVLDNLVLVKHNCFDIKMPKPLISSAFLVFFVQNQRNNCVLPAVPAF